MSRKIEIDVTNLPEVPQIPCENSTIAKKDNAVTTKSEGSSDQLVKMLSDLKEREISLFENIKNFDNENVEMNQVAEMSAAVANINNSNNNTCEEECRDYLIPMMNRTQTTISTLLATKESLDQLDSLHRIIHQLLTVQEQNYQMRKRLKTVKTLNALKEMEIQINSDPEKFLKSNAFLEDGSDMDNEGMIEFEQNIADLETILAASKSASNKRHASKKQRSKSIISDADELMQPLKENNRNYPLRRQSAISDFKPKVSKWTKVKAAFKWEKANTLSLNESKSSDSILSPHSDSLKNFLKVPSTPAPLSCNSGDSIISTSSGKVFTGTSGSLREIISSSGDENDETAKGRNFIRPPSLHDDERRSYSLDGEHTFGTNSHHSDKSASNKNSKSAWSKVKGIVTSRNSRKSVKSTGSGNSRDVSPIEFNDQLLERSDSISSPNQSSSSPNNLNIGMTDLCPTSDENENRQVKNLRQVKKNSKKNKTILEIESLPENETFDVDYSKKHLPSPLTLKKDFSESDSIDGCTITPTLKKPNCYKNLSISSPNSPLKTQEFFSEVDFSSGADNDNSNNSEPFSPLKRGSNNSSQSSRQQYEIMKNYQELQKKITLEFKSKQQEWGKIRPLVLQLNNSIPSYLKEDSSLPSTPKNVIENLIVNEENLSADFKRKLEEWRMKKGQQSMKDVNKKSMTPKSGQAKCENQGLVALPEFKDLPEEFQKKFNEWKQMKAEGRSPPPYSHQTSVQEKLKRQFSKTDKSSSTHETSIKKSKTFDDKTGAEIFPLDVIEDEIVVQTSEGLMKFKGISRSFTRKLYEWEKAKGIEPASDESTFAFLHPKYKAKLDENENKDFENGMKRALSVDSIVRPVQSISQLSQPSSLSLNDADNIKEPSDKKASSNIKLYSDINETQYNLNEEPEAIIVEVEDEVASPYMQIPIFKFDFAHHRNNKEEEPNKRLIDLQILAKQFHETTLNSSNINSTTNLEIIKHLCEKLKYLIEIFSQMKMIQKDEKSEILVICTSLKEDIHSMASNEFTLPVIINELYTMDLSVSRIEEVIKSFDEVENYLNSNQHQATSSIQNYDDKAIATIKITPTFMCNSVKIGEPTQNISNINTHSIAHLKLSSESEMPEASTEDMKSDDKSSKKVTRNSSSSSKRKIRLRRMGSRQNSKTESDSDEEFSQSAEAQRKIKRKTSRAKKTLESDKSFDSFQGEEEIVYIFKIKPGETNEVTTRTIESTDVKHSDSVLISPTENCVELIEVSSNDISSTTYTNPIVKTKRKIFTPVDHNNEDNNSNNALFISREIESSSGSEKNDKGKSLEEIEIVSQVPNPIIEMTSKSSLQQFESTTNEKTECVRKDLSPSIRLMIEKYHHNIEHKSAPNSNSSSPIWLSPILDRRVRKQSAEYSHKISKSSSFQENDEDSFAYVNENVNLQINKILNSQSNTDETSTKKDLEKDDDEKFESLENKEEPKNFSTGAIPKTPQIQLIRSSGNVSDSVCFNENFSFPIDYEKPKTPLNERALKLKQAKEAFFKNPIMATESEQNKWNYRMSQISVGSTDSNSLENMSHSCSVLPTKDSSHSNDQNEVKTSSLPRNIPPSTVENQDFKKDSPKHSKFGLTSLATKFRKVKLKRNAIDIQKMNTVPVLCRQSLNLFSESSVTNDKNSNLSNTSDDVQKSKSLGKF